MPQIKDLRKIKLTWAELAELLKKQGNSQGLLPNEEIREITLMKPRELLIRTEQK